MPLISGLVSEKCQWAMSVNSFVVRQLSSRHQEAQKAVAEAAGAVESVGNPVVQGLGTSPVRFHRSDS